MSAEIIHFLIFPGGLFALVLGIFMLSLERIVVARLQGRVGPPIYQNFIDVIKLFNKEILVPKDSKEIVFMYAPVLGFAALIAMLYFIPLPGVYEGAGNNSDLIILIYVMALPAISHILGGSASSSPYAAIAVNRELKLMLVYEVVFVIIAFSIALYVGKGSAVLSLKDIMNYQLNNSPLILDWKFWPAIVAFVIFVLATMEFPPFQVAHHNDADVMDGFLIEHSSIPLAIYEMTDALKIVLLSIVFQIFFCPCVIGGDVVVNLLFFIAKTVIFVMFFSLLHAIFASFRIDQAFKFLIIVPTTLSLITLVLVILSIKGLI
ncbi:respiratory chain complex I subunit 1 family protein [Caminibacter pacificus]|uniref:NADH-quinone oxidoreductase subunit H n=1 Tax=Caminibacter pacificus TaxID=1424653 RepID=A0AAJ4UYA8_9BACT|nr:complex I subunit 1 family protein [Caminibacter pacificus]NPA87966.1 NADH-quinone oxidoreductase subunit H [Campylobacterota bacterium]QCI28541.1 NADH-quinone oxidoreductase subunit H [Caminibacter pacificus]ROR40732.1 NADH-quinone oxidoreductase subunit H [Caminibacter pacificus]